MFVLRFFDRELPGLEVGPHSCRGSRCRAPSQPSPPPRGCRNPSQGAFLSLYCRNFIFIVFIVGSLYCRTTSAVPRAGGRAGSRGLGATSRCEEKPRVDGRDPFPQPHNPPPPSGRDWRSGPRRRRAGPAATHLRAPHPSRQDPPSHASPSSELTCKIKRGGQKKSRGAAPGAGVRPPARRGVFWGGDDHGFTWAAQ